MSKKTLQEHQKIIEKCKLVFGKKNKDYGTAWRILRLPTFTDQIMIKAQRIRHLQDCKKQMVDDDICTDFIGIVNYAIMALMQIALVDDKRIKIPDDELGNFYDACVAKIKDLLKKKNHDYNESWRTMRISSIVDLILMKLLRIKSIEDIEGKVIASEGVYANYQDIVNYAVFCLIRLSL